MVGHADARAILDVLEKRKKYILPLSVFETPTIKLVAL
jgi:hypothetical protein